MKTINRETNCGLEYEYKNLSDYSKVKFYERYYKLIFVINGELNLIINDQSLNLEEQSYMIVRPTDNCVFLGKAKDTNLLFLDVSDLEMKKLFDYLQNNVEENIAQQNEPLFVSGDYNVKLKIDEFRNRVLKYGDQGMLISRLIAIELVSGIVRAMHRKRHSDAIPSHVVEAVNGLRTFDNLRQGIKYLEIALNYSRSQLCKIFKKYYDKTPYNYVMELRLSYAYNMIVYTDYDFVTIAELVGISSISHFYEKFKNQYKVTPADLRRSNKRAKDNE